MARRQAAENLGRSPDPAAVPLLETLLGDAHPFVRATACESLGALRSRASVPKLSTVLSGDADPRVRQAAAIAFVSIGDAAAAGPLTGALKDGAAPVRHAAIRALGKLRADGAVGFVGRAVGYRRRGPQIVAASLGEIGSGRAALSSALSDADAASAASRQGSRLIGDAGARPALANALGRRRGVRVQAATALAKSGDRASGHLRRPQEPGRDDASAGGHGCRPRRRREGLARSGRARRQKDAGVKGVMDFMLAQLHARLGQPAAITAPSKKAPIKKNPAKTPAKKVTR